MTTSVFKHVRNYLSNVITVILLWVLQYVWTLPGFVIVLSYLYRNPLFRNIADIVIKWFNRKVEDYLYLADNEKRVALIIGADNAVGYCLAKKLLRKKYHVVMGVKTTKIGLKMKRKLLHNDPYGQIAVLSIDMSNPMNVFWFAKRIRHIIRRIDVLFINNSVINIESMDWNVMYEALRSRNLGYFFTSGKAHPDGKFFITPVNLGKNEHGLGTEFCQQVLSPFILIQELKHLLASANMPGRIVWTGSTTCDKDSFHWDDPQHLHGHLSFYSHKYLIHLLQPALNQQLASLDVQSFEGCPGLILTGTSPRFFRNSSILVYFLGYFVPTIQLWPSTGARTLLHIGTHRKEYKDLDPNHLYYMQWRLKGLVRCPYVEDVNMADSKHAFDYVNAMYKELRNCSMVVDGMDKTVEAICSDNSITRSRSQSA